MTELPEKGRKELKKEVEKKGLQLSIFEGSKEGKSKVWVSFRYLEEKLRVCNRREGVVLAESVEPLGVDLRAQTEAAGSEREGDQKEVRCEMLAHQEASGLPGELLENRCEEVVHDWLGSCESVERRSRGHLAYKKIAVEEADGSSKQARSRYRSLCSCRRMTSKSEKNTPPWPRKENGLQSRKKRGESTFLRFIRGESERARGSCLTVKKMHRKHASVSS